MVLSSNSSIDTENARFFSRYSGTFFAPSTIPVRGAAAHGSAIPVALELVVNVPADDALLRVEAELVGHRQKESADSVADGGRDAR